MDTKQWHEAVKGKYEGMLSLWPRILCNCPSIGHVHIFDLPDVLATCHITEMEGRPQLLNDQFFHVSESAFPFASSTALRLATSD